MAKTSNSKLHITISVEKFEGVDFYLFCLFATRVQEIVWTAIKRYLWSVGHMSINQWSLPFFTLSLDVVEVVVVHHKLIEHGNFGSCRISKSPYSQATIITLTNI